MSNKKEPFTPYEIAIVYNMCGAKAINPEMTAMIFNGLLAKGKDFDLKTACEIRVKIPNPAYKGLNRPHRNYLIYKRNH